MRTMTATATAINALQAYFGAWNRRDAQAIVAAFDPGGTYTDPAAGEALQGEAMAAYADGLFAAFPDLCFELQEPRPTGPGTFVAEWTMRGSNTGPLNGAPPTGRRVALPGVDLVELGDPGLRSVRGFFDQQTLVEQLGLQALVLPHRVGPVSFGYAVRWESDSAELPGAMSLTMLEVRTEEEAAWVRETTGRMLPEIMRLRGFLGTTTAAVGRRLYTMTAWREPEDAHQLRTGPHAEAMREVYGGRIGSAGLTGIWTPLQLAARVRCGACGEWQRSGANDCNCYCGARLADRPPLW
jgi:predicted ester cyclase